MRRTFLKVALASVLLALTGCGETGSGTAGSDTRSVGSFDAIEVHGALDAAITVGGAPSVVITGDDNLIGLVETSVVGDKLVIQPKGSMTRKLPMKVTITTKELTDLGVHGASEAQVTGIDTDELSVQLHGASKAHLEGKANKLEAEVHGASSLDAQKLAAKEVQLQAHGASSVELGAPNSISAWLDGASSATYDGSPTIDEKLSGSSSISKR